MSRSTPASDASSLGEILASYEADGYGGQTAVRPGGRVLCLSCHRESPAQDFAVDRLCRTEGASDPDDMLAVAAVVCPACATPATLVLAYGPEADEDQATVLAALHDGRPN